MYSLYDLGPEVLDAVHREPHDEVVTNAHRHHERLREPSRFSTY